jgi:hypothetical protein
MDDKEKAKNLVEHASRWMGNIVTEVLGNYGQYLPDEVRDDFLEISSLLHGIYRKL